MHRTYLHFFQQHLKTKLDYLSKFALLFLVIDVYVLRLIYGLDLDWMQSNL